MKPFSYFAKSEAAFWQPGIIPYSQLDPVKRGTVQTWFAGDNAENYTDHPNRQFSIEDVNYHFNAHGYRSDEFDLMGETPALMFIGCSNTMGVGLPRDVTWPALVTREVEKTWDMPLLQYNLGWSAASTDYVTMIVYQVIDVLKPKAVFVLWPSANRLAWFQSKSERWDFTPKNFATIQYIQEEHEAYLRLMTDAHGFFNFVKNYNFVAMKCAAANIPFFCGWAYKFDPAHLKACIPTLTHSWEFQWYNSMDFARDGVHAGLSAHVAWAKQMLEQFKAHLLSCGP